MTWAFDLGLDTVERYAFYKEAFTSFECQKIIEEGKKQNLTTAAIGSDNYNLEYRDSKISIFTDTTELYWLYEKVSYITSDLNKQFFNFDLFGFSEPFQFTEYNAPSGKYDAHMDSFYKGNIRKLSICVQLTDPSEYEGGELELLFDTFPTSLDKTQGCLYAFPSYTVHRVNTVTKGTRHSLVAWATGKPFR